MVKIRVTFSINPPRIWNKLHVTTTNYKLPTRIIMLRGVT